MPDTIRTTVTLSKASMKQVEDLVGVLGNTPASVISRIVEFFFDYGRFDDILEKLKDKKRELYPPKESVIYEKITNFFKWGNKIPLDDFIEYLEVNKKYALENFHIWAEKFNLKLIENFVIKEY